MPQIDDKDTRTDVIRKSLFLDLNWFQTLSHLLVFLLLNLGMEVPIRGIKHAGNADRTTQILCVHIVISLF